MLVYLSMRSLPIRDFHRLFLERGELEDPAAEGHYTVAGNSYVAQLLARERVAAGPLPPVLPAD